MKEPPIAGAGTARIAPYGSRGILVELDLVDSRSRAERTVSAAAALGLAFPRAEVVTGAGTVALFCRESRESSLPGVEEIVRCLAEVQPVAGERRTHEIPVVYDGLDLDAVARASGLSSRAVVELHAATEYLCELVGFMPGFGYLGTNPKELTLPRRAEPRARVPVGSVALASAFTGIYPFESPGGWQLIGRSLGPALFDVERPEPFLLSAGDRIRFVRVAPKDAPAPRRVLDIQLDLRRSPRVSGLFVLGGSPLMSLQDEGRFAALGRGIPASGPLSSALRRSTERALGNPRGCATLEIVGGGARFRAVGEVNVSLDGAKSRLLRDGETFDVPPGESWARYLGIGGGFEARTFLGSNSTLVTADIGGAIARPGDFLALAREVGSGAYDDPIEGFELLSGENGPAQIRVDPGPHLEHFAEGALERFMMHEYEISRSVSRVGQRLLGPKVERRSADTLLPTPMTRGAIEVPASGEPIVLGPDHPTTGGYPVLAVVRPNAWDVLGRLGPGRRVRFVLA